MGRKSVHPGGTEVYVGGQVIQFKIDTEGRRYGGIGAVNVYVVQDLKEPLLGRSAIESFGMLQWVEEVNQLRKKFDPWERYPKLFEGLSLMAATHIIRLKNDAVPVSLHAPHRAALPLQPKLTQEVDKMVNMGIISPMNRPIEWCSGIVIVPKQNGQIRLCVDLRALNTSVQTEHTILPAAGDSLAQRLKAKVFSELDTNSGYWQGNELYPCKHTWSDCHMDDVLVFGEDGTEHYENLDKVLWELEAAGITLNDKCTFGTDRVKFLGYVISSEGVEADPAKNLRKGILLITNHQPLVSILGNKNIDELPPRLQRHRMQLMRYTYQGSIFIPLMPYRGHLSKEQTEAARRAQSLDATCRELKKLVQEGWPQRPTQVPPSCQAYWQNYRELSVVEGTLMKGVNMAIPARLQKEIMYPIHLGHLGIKKCTERARRQCSGRVLRMISKAVSHAVVGMDLEERDGTHYLVIIDYYSQYPEIFQLPDTKTSTTISNKVFPERFDLIMVPRIAPRPLNGFSHVTSNPRYAQSNGQVEAAIKNLFMKKQRVSKKHTSTDAIEQEKDFRYNPTKVCGLTEVWESNIRSRGVSIIQSVFTQTNHYKKPIPPATQCKARRKMNSNVITGQGVTHWKVRSQHQDYAMREHSSPGGGGGEVGGAGSGKGGRRGRRMEGMAEPAGSTVEVETDNTSKNEVRMRIVRQVYYLREGKMCYMREVVCREVGEPGVERIKE
ncbi:hypothetical protein PR048_017384 [Dryococelus australis]|uniref:Uncharacterized protein n=1 Tax=Dryococelus australis TaxID=614101 RepID=A0ABQ9H9L9_9NEOP|nr:hypothetical protein PR048_017384 [Dryococelus australis]